MSAWDEETILRQQISEPRLYPIILFFVITWSIALGLWYNQDLDKTILFALNNTNFNNTITNLSKLVSRYGMALITGINLLLLILSFRDEKMKKLRPVFLATILSYGVSGISGDLLKMVFKRPRPIITYAGELNFLSDSHSPAFPSGHATKSVALVAPLSFSNISNNQLTIVSKLTAITTAILVCLSRIVLGAHYLSDVIAGAGWSVLCLPVSVCLTNIILSKMSPERYEKASRIWIIVYIALIFLVATI